MTRPLAVLLLAGLACTAPALGQEFGVSELRGGVFVHSADEPGDLFGVFSVERMHDINVELLFAVPAMRSWLVWGELRPHIGATFNFGGLESMVYGGLSWTVPIAESPLFLEASLGGAVHNGNTLGNAVYPARNLGCGLVFRESVSLGVKLNDNASIMATAEHASNANLCDNGNRGLTNLGIRFGYRF